MKSNFQSVFAFVASMALAVLLTDTINAAGIKGYTPFDKKGDCKIKSEAGYDAVVLNKEYAFGRTVKTGRNSYLDVRFSKGNTFRLLARTTITITEDVKDPNLKILQLTGGSVDLKLDRYPADHKLQVETPSAICGAVGTRFVVAFESDEGGEGNRMHSFSCEKGEVEIASRFTIADEVVIGQSFAVSNFTAGSEMVAQLEEGLNNAYTDVTVNRGRLDFTYGGREGVSFSVEAEPPAPGMRAEPPRFTCALEKRADGTSFVAFKMIRGTAKFSFFGGRPGSERISSRDGGVLIPARKVETSSDEVVVIERGARAEEVATLYIEKSKAETIEKTKLETLKTTGASETQVSAQEAVVSEAAAQADAVKQSLLNETPFKVKVEDIRDDGAIDEEQEQQQEIEDQQEQESVEPQAETTPEQQPTVVTKKKVVAKATTSTTTTTTTPTASQLQQAKDTDGDGIPDAEEISRGLNPAVPNTSYSVSKTQGQVTFSSSSSRLAAGRSDILEFTVPQGTVYSIQAGVTVTGPGTTTQTASRALITEPVFTKTGQVYNGANGIQVVFLGVEQVGASDQRRFVFSVSKSSNAEWTGSSISFTLRDASGEQLDIPITVSRAGVAIPGSRYVAVNNTTLSYLNAPHNPPANLLIPQAGFGVASPFETPNK